VLDLRAERFAGAEEMLLPDKLLKGAGAHALGQGSGDGRGGFIGTRSEEAHFGPLHHRSRVGLVGEFLGQGRMTLREAWK
jgi:hypothetical protein